MTRTLVAAAEPPERPERPPTTAPIGANITVAGWPTPATTTAVTAGWIQLDRKP